MTPIEMRELFAYDSWANALVFDAAAALPADQLDRPLGSSFPSIHLTLGHVVGAEWVWLRRWLGDNPTSFPDWVGRPALADLRERLVVIERERDRFAAGVTDADLARQVQYKSLAGQPNSNALGDLVRHVVNHSSYHRGQVTTMLRQVGQKPPSTDLIVFLRKKA